MKAIVVTDQAAGTAGMTLGERPEPQAAINDAVVQVHASGFVPTELAWPSTWTDRRGRDRTPSIPGHELAGVVTRPGDARARRSSAFVPEDSGTTPILPTVPWPASARTPLRMPATRPASADKLKTTNHIFCLEILRCFAC